jgi:hypothetical protein
VAIRHQRRTMRAARDVLELRNRARLVLPEYGDIRLTHAVHYRTAVQPLI